MKRKVYLQTIAFLFVLSCMLSMQACKSDNFVKVSYRTLSVAGITYDTAMKVAADAYKQNIIPETTKEQIIKYGNVYYQSYETARQGLEIYYKALVSNETIDKTQIVSDFAKMVQDLKQLVAFVQEVTKRQVVAPELPLAPEVQGKLGGGTK